MVLFSFFFFSLHLCFLHDFFSHVFWFLHFLLNAFFKCLIFTGYPFVFKSKALESWLHVPCSWSRGSKVVDQWVHCRKMGSKSIFSFWELKCQYLQNFSLELFILPKEESFNILPGLVITTTPGLGWVKRAYCLVCVISFNSSVFSWAFHPSLIFILVSLNPEPFIYFNFSRKNVQPLADFILLYEMEEVN